MTRNKAKAARAGWMDNPMRDLPTDDAPMAEWVRPVSALMKTRRTCFFGNDDRAADRGAQSNMAMRMNKIHRKRAVKINMTEFWRLHDKGVGVVEMADRLDVSTRSVERAMTMRRIDG